MNPLVMLYGRDSTLLWTRQMILEQAHFNVRTADEEAELYRALSSAPFQILVLCHSVTEPERTAICHSAHASNPAIKILVLTTSDDHFLIQDAISNTLYGPQTFLAAVRRLAGAPIHAQSTLASSP